MLPDQKKQKSFFHNKTLAVLGGSLLSLMLYFNGIMAKLTSPVFASWLIHGIGTMVAILFVFVMSIFFNIINSNVNSPIKKAPFWSYAGGIPGALAVVLSAVTINSRIGLAGTLSLMLVGQSIFAIIADYLGIVAHPQKSMTTRDFLFILSALTGSTLIIFFKV